MPKVCVAEPSAFSLEEIEDFVALVLAGGEVATGTLKKLVMRAQQVAFLREGNCLLGVGGLKNPSTSYRQKVEKGSKVRLGVEPVPFELGWIFILPSARNRKLSFPLCRALVSAANEGGIFATSRSENIGMQRTLEKLGFVRSGTEWPSAQSGGTLALFLKLPSNSAPDCVKTPAEAGKLRSTQS